MRGYFLMPVGALALLAGCGESAEEAAVRQATNGEVDVSRDGDGTVTYSTDDGEARITTGDLGDAAPAGLPRYPGADTSRGVNIDASGRNGGSGQISSFQTSDPPDRVIAFYRAALERQGYEITATMDMGQSKTITATRENGNDGVHVSATGVGGQGTTVSIIAGGGR